MSYNDVYDKAVASGKAIRISSTIYKFKEVGETLVGKLIEIGSHTFTDEDTGEQTDRKVFFIDTDDGVLQTILGTAFDKLTSDKLVINNIYAITYKGKIDIDDEKQVNNYDILDCGKDTNDGKSKK